MSRRRPGFLIRGPATMVAVALALVVILTVLWNVVLVHDYRKLRALTSESGALHGTFIALGSALFLAIIVLCSLIGAKLITSIRRRQEQAAFLATASHELNSPLSAIKLFTQTLRNPDLAVAERDRFVGKILLDVDRLSRIIANMLRAAELDRHELRLARRDIQLPEFLDEYAGDARRVHGDRIDLVCAGGGDAWVSVDPMMLRQVLDNLIDNAVRYSGDKRARVELRVEAFDGWVELQVADQGIGIEPEARARIFERFYRADPGAGNGGGAGVGMGIGLSVVRDIVESHGGTVGVRSDGRGRGATIFVRFPAPEAAEVTA